MVKVVIYSTEMGHEPYSEYFRSIKDPIAKGAVARAQYRMGKGLMGTVRSLDGGLKETKIDVGEGHRIYFYNDGQEIIILLSGSVKKSQGREIEKAKLYLSDYKRQKKTRKNGDAQ